MKKIALTIALLATAGFMTACVTPKPAPAPFVMTTPNGDEVYCEWERADGDWDCEPMND